MADIILNNYVITPSVDGSGNLTVALKTLAGADASAAAPIVIRIGGVDRYITAALSRTLAAATNWMNLGSAELATKEVDLFPYVVWNTNTSAVDFLLSRIPYANVYSDFSSTTTNEKYGATSTAAAATDNVVNIGRFAATLSAGAGYTWTVPTYTTANLIQRPIYETRIRDWIPQWSNLTQGSATLVAKYQIHMNKLWRHVALTWAADTSISGIPAYTLPMGPDAAVYTFTTAVNLARFYDQNPGVSYAALAYLISAANVWLFAQDASGTYITVANPSSTVPFTWTTSDQISDEGTLQLA